MSQSSDQSSNHESAHPSVADILLDHSEENSRCGELPRHFRWGEDGKKSGGFDRRRFALMKAELLHRTYPSLSGVSLECSNRPECCEYTHGTPLLSLLFAKTACVANSDGQSWVDSSGNPGNCWENSKLHPEELDPPKGCHARAAPNANTLKICDMCLSALQLNVTADALVVGTTVHLLEARGGREGVAGRVADDIRWLRAKHSNMVWTSGPSVEVKKITKSQQKFFTPANLNGIFTVYEKTCHEVRLRVAVFTRIAPYLWSPVCHALHGDNLSPQQKNGAEGPCLDMHHLTGRCIWNNCTVDGVSAPPLPHKLPHSVCPHSCSAWTHGQGHRARFVNRMKAQMLLNTLCTTESFVDDAIQAMAATHPVATWQESEVERVANEGRSAKSHVLGVSETK